VLRGQWGYREWTGEQEHVIDDISFMALGAIRYQTFTSFYAADCD